MENSNDTVKVIGALVVGAIAGAALGVLFAPEKGSNTRTRILEGAKDLADDLKKKMRNEAKSLRNKAEELESLAEDKIHDLANNVKLKVETFMPNN